MNAPTTDISAPRQLAQQAGWDGRPDLREDIWENLGGLAIYCDVGQRFAEKADDAGLGYSLRCIVAHVKALIATHNDLVAATKRLEGGN